MQTPADRVGDTSEEIGRDALRRVRVAGLAVSTTFTFPAFLRPKSNSGYIFVRSAGGVLITVS